jgi:hypothetical protein
MLPDSEKSCQLWRKIIFPSSDMIGNMIGSFKFQINKSTSHLTLLLSTYGITESHSTFLLTW